MTEDTEPLPPKVGYDLLPPDEFNDMDASEFLAFADGHAGLFAVARRES